MAGRISIDLCSCSAWQFTIGSDFGLLLIQIALRDGVPGFDDSGFYTALILLTILQIQYSMLNLVGRGLKSIGQKQIGKGVNIQHIDLSNNDLSRGIEFAPMINLVTLIIDDNRFTVLTDFPVFKKLETFSANKNDFADLTTFLVEALDRFGNLKNISLLKNPINPFFEGEQKYLIYRDRILEKFPTLQTMDGCSVSIIKKQKQQKLKEEEEQYEKLAGTAVYDSKYANNELKSVKTRSEGHRFVKNNQL